MPISALTGAVATPHAAATRSAERAFERGGNALDAALAAAATLSVVYPHNVSIGGDLIALVRDPAGVVRCVNASGPAPCAVDADALRDAHGDVLPYRGIDTVTVPGAIRGWEVLHRMGGARPWEEIFGDAVDAARYGAPVARSLAEAFREEEPAIGFDPGFRAVFLSGGRLPERGDQLVQSALADTLDAIRSGGADALYDGPLTAGFVAGLAAAGSRLASADLLLFRPEVVDPLTSAFGPYRVLTSPPNTHGFVLLRVLREIERDGIVDPLGTGFGAVMERFFAANLVRDERLADPRASRQDLAALLDGAPGVAEEPVLPGFRRPRGDTVGIAVADSSGWSVSLIQSVFHAFGSAVVEPSTGILLHNRGTSFSLDPMSPNLIAPGKRPLHTLTPVLVTEGDDLRFVSATMGGQGQPQIHAQTLLRAMAGASAAEAVTAPRAIVGPQHDGDRPSDVYAEPGLSPAARESLEATALRIIETSDPSELVGHANLVVAAEGARFDAGSDPRSDGAASVRDYPGDESR